MPALPNDSDNDVILQDGQVFVGQYKIGKELGRGGFGAVYLAEEIRLKRKVAIKVLHPKLARDKKTVRRFEIEAIASSRLTHPSVAQVYATGKAEDGSLYIAMEYVEGETLQARFKAQHALNQRLGSIKVLQIGLQVARVLAAAHDKGITHRDLKPHNLMLTADEDAPGGERVKILDFGIAKLTSGEDDEEGATSTGDQLPGTIAYMAPEQFGEYRGVTNLEGRMDVYALGVILYTGHAGRLPLYDKDSFKMMGLALIKKPDPLRSIDPSISPGVAELVHAMLIKEATVRPTMANVRDRLVHLLGLSASRPEIVAIRPTAEHRAMHPDLNSEDLEDAFAATGDAPAPGGPVDPSRPSATPSTALKASKSVGARSTQLQLASGDLLMSTGRGGSGQQHTGPDTLRKRRRTGLMGALMLAALIVTGGGLAVWRLQGAPVSKGKPVVAVQVPSLPEKAAVPPTANTVPPLSPGPATPATMPAVAPTTTSKVETVHKARDCTPAIVSEHCISGTPLTKVQQRDLVAAVAQAGITLCPKDRIVLSTNPRVEVRKASGPKRAQIEDLSLALRGSGLSFTGEVVLQCKRP